MNGRILISGAGIAGPAVAYWLDRHGFAIDVRGPGADVVKRMALWPQVQALSTKFQKFECVDGDDRTVAVLKVGPLKQALEMDDVWVEVMRADLSRILYDQTRQKVEYLFGDSITALSDDGDGVEVSFDSGTERRFELVIGADGQRSNVRNLAFGENASFEKYLGYYVAVAAIEYPTPPPHTALNYSEPAGELKRAQGDYMRAFGAYEAVLRPVVEATQKQIGHTGRLMVPKTRLGIGLRNRIAPVAVSLLTSTAWAWKGLLSRTPSTLIRDY